jgi:hypothetical protein
MSSKYWIERAIKRPGTYKAQTQHAGETRAEFANEREDARGKSGKRARLVETLLKMQKEKG